MERVTQLQRLTSQESEVIDLYRMLDETEQAFMRGMMLKALESANNRPKDNVVRLRLGQQ